MASRRFSPTMVTLVMAVFVLQLIGSASAIFFLRTQMLDVVRADRMRQVIDVRDDLLAAYYDGGRAELAEFIAARRGSSADPLIFIAVTGAGPPLLSNLAVAPDLVPATQPQRVDVRRGNDAAVIEGVALSSVLPDGERLVVGALAQSEKRVNLAFAEAIGLTIAVAVTAASISALLLGLVISRRTHALAETASALAAGDFAARVPQAESGDGFDHLRIQMNHMAERIGELVGQLRLVSGALAHDLRSPVARLSAAIDTALARVDDAGADADAVEALHAARTDAEQLQSMLETALDISRLEGGALEDRRVALNLGEVAEDLAELYEPLAEQSGVLLDTAIVPVTVLADRELLSRALANLIDNALKYGGRHIRVSTRASAGWGEVSVSDDGPGIPPEDRARAVERFTRLDNARTRPGGGLGLAMVAAVARHHGGRLELSDGETASGDGGLVVTLRLPKA